MSGNTKVLTGLAARRALHAAFDELAEATTPDLLAERADRIAEYGSAALAILLARVDTDDPQLRGGLGQVAARLNRDQVVPALRSVARSRAASEAARLTALTILDRFLDVPVDDALLIGLPAPDQAAQQSLRELQREMERNPFSVIEYLGQMAEQPPEVARLIVDAVPLSPPDPHLITFLRMVAQGEDASLARAAIERLGRMRCYAAVQALSSLTATLPPERAAAAERGLRKLRLSGAANDAPDDSQRSRPWRALLSPVDGTGAQLIWFVAAPEGSRPGCLMVVLCADGLGIVTSFGSTEVSAEALPPSQPIGGYYRVEQADRMPAITLLEAPFDAGRRAVREALEQNWKSGHPTPMEYRLLNRLIWEAPYSPAAQPEAESVSDHSAVGNTAALLDHPAFANWFWQPAELPVTAQRLGYRPSALARRVRISELADAQFGSEEVASYVRRLEKMACWLLLADQPEAAALSHTAIRELRSLPPRESPFIRRLIGIGLDMVLINARGSGAPRPEA